MRDEGLEIRDEGFNWDYDYNGYNGDCGFNGDFRDLMNY